MDTQPAPPTSSAPAPASRHPRHGRRRAGPAVAAAVTLLALGAAGCGNGSNNSAGSATTPAAAGSSAAPTSQAPAPSSPTAAPGTLSTADTTSAAASSAPPPSAASTAAPAGSSRCLATELGLSLGRGDPGAGNVYFPLTFTNKSGHACVLNGYPGVSLIRRDGSTIGKPADRQGARGAAVTLGPGRSATADLHTLNQGVKGDSCWTAPSLLKVYPPGSLDALTLRITTPVVCGDTFDVDSLHIGALR